MTRLIYPLENGGIAIVTPTGELPIEEVARKDVPAGVPYKFVGEEDIPADRLFRNAWEAEFSNPDGYGIGPDAWFAENPPPPFEPAAILQPSEPETTEEQA